MHSLRSVFRFFKFRMNALARMPSSAGITAMQSINVVVLNRSFLGVFIGTAFISSGVVVLTLKNLTHPAAMFYMGGAILYFAGTFLVTMFKNVPLNNRLAAVSSTDSAAISLWTHYLNRWTMWNHVRTTATMAAALMYCLGLVQGGSI